MVETTGKKLAQARLAKGLTVDEVAYATKLRPDKVLALEQDDYSRFPNNAYVKGFLQIYGRFLGVDVGGAVKELENPSPVSVSDYQYLNHAPQPQTERIPLRRQTNNKPSLAPLIVFLVLCAMVGAGGYFYLTTQRLGNLDELPRPHSGETTLEQPAAGVPKPVATPIPTGDAPVNSPVAPGPIPAPAVAEASATVPTSIPNPRGLIDSGEMRPVAPSASDRDFISPLSATSPPVIASVNEVILQPMKKTWVRVRQDDPNSAPIFEDYLYTNAPPLKLRGARFFIEVREEGAVTIRKNGAPIAYQAPGVTIQ